MKILKGRSVLFIVKKAWQNTEANGELMEVVQRAQDLIQVVRLTNDEATTYLVTTILHLRCVMHFLFLCIYSFRSLLPLFKIFNCCTHLFMDCSVCLSLPLLESHLHGFQGSCF